MDSSNRANGIGGVFIYANDPKLLSEWYAEHFGFQFVAMNGGKTFYVELMSRNDKDPAKREMTVFAIMTAKKPLSGERSEFMVNYRVSNMDRFLEDLETNGIEIERTENLEYGRFAWIRDPEGNHIEIWNPAEQPAP